MHHVPSLWHQLAMCAAHRRARCPEVRAAAVAFGLLVGQLASLGGGEAAVPAARDPAMLNYILCRVLELELAGTAARDNRERCISVLHFSLFGATNCSLEPSYVQEWSLGDEE